MQSKATTVKQFLSALPEVRRAAISAVRKVILENLDSGFEEGMQYGMIGYYVPHSIYPAGYHCDPKQPLGFVCLASQKNHMSLYAMSLYGDATQEKLFKEEFPSAVTQRCWVHSLRNSVFKTPERLREAFKIQAHKIMYAASENEARVAFSNLEEILF